MSDVATITIKAENFSNQLEASLNSIKKFAKDAQTNVDTLNKSTSEMMDPLKKVNNAFVNMTGIDPLGPIIGGIETGVGHVKKLAEDASANLSKAFTIPENITSAIDSKIRDPIKNTISFADTLSESASEMLEPLKNVNDVFIGMTGVDALGPVIGGIETGIGYVQSFSSGMEKLNGLLDIQKIATEAQSVAQGALNAIMNMNPIGLIVLAIAALVAGFILLWNNCEGFRNFFIGLWDNLKEIGAWLADVFGQTFIALGEIVANVWDVIKNAFSIAWEWICGVFAGIGVWFSERWNEIVAVFSVVSEWFGGVFTAAWEWICLVFAGIGVWFSERWNEIVVVFSVVSEWFGGVFTAAWDLICGVFAGIGVWFSDRWNEIVAIFSVVSEWFGGIFTDAWNGICGVFTGIGVWFSDRWNEIVAIFSVVSEWFGGVFTDAWNGISGIFSGIGTWFGDRWNDIVAIFSGVNTWFSDRFSEAWVGVKNIFSGVEGFFQGIWDSITRIFTNIGTTIGNGIGDAFKTVVNSIIGFAERTINGFINAINMAIGLINAIPGVSISKLSLLSIPRLADGGIVYTGQMFIAREAGPELVGTIGSRSAVVNNDQIVESVSAGVYRAVRDAMKGFNSGGGGHTIMVDKRVLGQVVSESLNGYSRSLGHVPLTT